MIRKVIPPLMFLLWPQMLKHQSSIHYLSPLILMWCFFFLVVLCLPLMENGGSHIYNLTNLSQSIKKVDLNSVLPFLLHTTHLTKYKPYTNQLSHFSCTKVSGRMQNQVYKKRSLLLATCKLYLIKNMLLWFSLALSTFVVKQWAFAWHLIQVKQECAGGGREPEVTGLHREAATQHEDSKSNKHQYKSHCFKDVLEALSWCERSCLPHLYHFRVLTVHFWSLLVWKWDLLLSKTHIYS